VLNAQKAGAALVIIYDYEDEPLFPMHRNSSKPPAGSSSNDDSDSTITIPSVLVSHSSGKALRALIAASTDPEGPVRYFL
jgi:PA domain